MQDTLYVHGGRTDQFNSYSYSAAPVTNDLFSLSLASSFDASSPPWKTISGCSNCSSEQGPAVAWHTLSTFNTTSLLLFGGDPGPNSPISLPVQSDSAVMLNVVNQEPSWNFENSSWANEPLRRIYHSSSSSKGKIWIVGGSKADGSDTAFSEHYVFDPDTTSFTQLSSNNAPPDIYGHQSVVLPNGWLLILGGYSPSQKTLVPFTEIWAIDTANPNNGWTTLDVSDKMLPTSRRGFAAVTLDAGRILIHGGADAELQQTFSDGWILDLTQRPVVWSSVNTLSQLGNRKDHFAVALGQVVFFGFGTTYLSPAFLFTCSQIICRIRKQWSCLSVSVYLQLHLIELPLLLYTLYRPISSPHYPPRHVPYRYNFQRIWFSAIRDSNIATRFSRVPLPHFHQHHTTWK